MDVNIVLEFLGLSNCWSPRLSAPAFFFELSFLPPVFRYPKEMIRGKGMEKVTLKHVGCLYACRRLFRASFSQVMRPIPCQYKTRPLRAGH